MRADLHCHSNCSDGKLPPHLLPALAKKAGADVFALTDHDTMCGVERARAAAKQEGIGFIGGVEISSYGECNVHVLGYNVDDKHQAFRSFEEKIAVCRDDRVREMIGRLNKRKVKITYEDVMEFAVRSPSRAHVARAMVSRGYAPDIKTCFDKWLKEGEPCYVPNDMITPVEAVELILKCGGVPVLAHPMRLKMSLESGEKLVKSLKDAGLEGIEASYKLFDESITAPFYAMAKKYDLFVTNGGDFHAPDRSAFVPRMISERTAAALGL